MRVLLTGAGGQLGRALVASAPAEAEIFATERGSLDITDASAVMRCVQSLRPTHIVNTAAFTAVDRAEAEEASAMTVNAKAVGYLAVAAREVSCHLTQISTDFVFDGLSGRPYRPDDSPSPLGAYGRSKLSGELLAGADAMVIRTAWVYAAHGSNFPLTMLKLFRERDTIGVVADQIGTPTWASSLAHAIWAMACKNVAGVHHYTDSGVASWYDFAVAIQEEALRLNLLTRACHVAPITSADYLTPAKRPTFSVLEKSDTYRLLGGPAAHWRANLRSMLEELKRGG